MNKEKIVERNLYFEKILPFLGNNLIKVITGQRRSGKSYFMLFLKKRLEQEYPDSNIIYLNKELHDFDTISTYKELLDFVLKRTRDGKNFVFIDEIQEIEGFEKALRSLASEDKYEIFCTGSNASLLSGELATLLSGRYIELRIHPLSYPEFLKFHKLPSGKESFKKYIKFGGMPFLIHLPFDEEIVTNYLSGIYNSIVLKDVIARYKIRNVDFLERLVFFLAENIGSLFSTKRITDFLKSQRISVSVNTVSDYLNFLESAFIINKVKRISILGKKVFELNEKYFFEDIGLRNLIVGFNLLSLNGILENIVYNHLVIAGYRVFVGKHNGYEIDFVAEKKGERLYIQVAYLIPDGKVREREFGNLLKIKDNYPKYVLSLDEFSSGNYMGIEHKNLIDFLMELNLKP